MKNESTAKMSLRTRLNLLITLLFILCLMGAGSYVIIKAEREVQERIETSAQMAIQLIEAAIIADDAAGETERNLLVQLAGLEITKRLRISILQEGERVREGAVDQSALPLVAPNWFVRLVLPESTEFRHAIVRPGLPHTEVVVWSNPAEAIAHAWGETRDVLVFLVTFALSINMLVFYTLGRGLAPLNEIQKGLEDIEQGDYTSRLPTFRLPELDQISKKFNNMTDVLRRIREENHLLSQRTLQIQETERRTLARELHDELGQTVSAIKAMAASIRDKAPTNVHQHSEAIIDYADRMYDVTKNLIKQLRPAVLDELGLIPALQDMIDTWNEQHQDMFCYFNHSNIDFEFNEEAAIHFYRIIQEGLTNAARHSCGSEVRIDLTRLHGAIVLTIRDDGTGNPDDLSHGGVGLAGIRERVGMLKGGFKLEGGGKRGLSLTVSVPLEEAA